MKVEPVRIEVRVESQEQGVNGEQNTSLLWKGTAQLVEPGRRPFEVIDSASCRDVASQEECVRLVVLALQSRIESVFGVGNRYDERFKTKLRELERQTKRK